MVPVEIVCGTEAMFTLFMTLDLTPDISFVSEDCSRSIPNAKIKCKGPQSYSNSCPSRIRHQQQMKLIFDGSHELDITDSMIDTEVEVTCKNGSLTDANGVVLDEDLPYKSK